MYRISQLLISLAMVASAAAASTSALAQVISSNDALKAATQKAKEIQAATGAKPVAKKLPSGDPCTTLPKAAVQSGFPGAKSGERSTRLKRYGITECQWKNAAGDVLLVLQESRNDGRSAKDDALGMAQGFVDPLNAKAVKNVRIEVFPSLDADAASLFETADPKRGILNDCAFLQLRKHEHEISLNAPGFAGRDRAQALKGFETLARLAANRL